MKTAEEYIELAEKELTRTLGIDGRDWPRTKTASATVALTYATLAGAAAQIEHTAEMPAR